MFYTQCFITERHFASRKGEHRIVQKIGREGECIPAKETQGCQSKAEAPSNLQIANH
jgi:hypothetical protein